MLDGNAYKALLSDQTEPDLIPRLRDPGLLNAFADLADDLRMVLKASNRGADQIEEVGPVRARIGGRRFSLD